MQVKESGSPSSEVLGAAILQMPCEHRSNAGECGALSTIAAAGQDMNARNAVEGSMPAVSVERVEISLLDVDVGALAGT